MRQFAKATLTKVFRTQAFVAKRYDIQKRMRVDFDGRYVIRTFPWGTVFLDTSNYEDDRLAKFDVLEPQLQHAFEALIKPNTIVLDIGANAGFHAILFASILRRKQRSASSDNASRECPQGRVFAFEPAPTNARSIRRNLSLNPDHRVTLIEAAVTDYVGEAELRVMPESSYWQGCHSLVENEKLATTHKGMTSSIKVEAVTVDKFLKKNELASLVSLIKIDVEGAEPSVLRGAREIIERHRPAIVMEMSDGRARFMKWSPDDFPEILRSEAYRSFVMHKDGSMDALTAFDDYFGDAVNIPHACEELLLLPSDIAEPRGQTAAAVREDLGPA